MAPVLYKKCSLTFASEHWVQPQPKEVTTNKKIDFLLISGENCKEPITA